MKLKLIEYLGGIAFRLFGLDAERNIEPIK